MDDGYEIMTEDDFPGQPPRNARQAGTLIDYDEGVMIAHRHLSEEKLIGNYNEDFYRGFCAAMRGFGEATVISMKAKKEEQHDE